VARLLISGLKSDSCSFMPWRSATAANTRNGRGLRAEDALRHERSRSGSARTNGNAAGRLAAQETKSHSASGHPTIIAAGRLGFQERSGFGAAQLRVEADTARRRPAGRAGSSTHESGRRHAARIASTHMRRAACRVGFGTWAPAVQLNAKRWADRLVHVFKEAQDEASKEYLHACSTAYLPSPDLSRTSFGTFTA
jgi:hypothetical protein